ncbi:shikimate dehydrogenase (plasmid) [Sinorhizobium meliloti]|nr:shikimate dehydrogenase [Sinorhizobium meliloti]
MTETLVRSLKAGLIGTGIQASLTPAMHMAEGAAQGIRYDYELIDLNLLGASEKDLPRLLADAERRGFAGLNITHPCKQAVIPYLDELTPEARQLGAVNTVVLRSGRRYGHNTDWWGFAEGFRRGLPDADLFSAVQLGAGGAGVATAYAALSLGLQRLVVFDREAGRAQALARMLSPSLSESRGGGRQRPSLGNEKCRRPHPRHADRHGEISRIAARRRASFAKPLGRRDRLFSAGNGASQGGPAAWLQNARRWRHGGVSGGRRVSAVHRARTRRRADARPLQGDDRLTAPGHAGFI